MYVLPPAVLWVGIVTAVRGLWSLELLATLCARGRTVLGGPVGDVGSYKGMKVEVFLHDEQKGPNKDSKKLCAIRGVSWVEEIACSTFIP
jgi:hypothetical protein